MSSITACFPPTTPFLLFLFHCSVPSAPPSSLLLHSNTARSITVSWKPPPPSKQNGVIIGYLFLYKCQEWFACEATTQFQTANLTVILSDLHPYTNYYIIVSALTSVGEGPRAQTHLRTWQDSEFCKLNCSQFACFCCNFL